MLVPIDFAPGVYGNGTELQAQGRWRDANLVRWWNGRMRPVGGWQKFTPTPLQNPPRGMITWRDNGQSRFLAAGTASKLYVHDGGALYDVTPAGFQSGNIDSLYGLGWGAGLYGMEAYGTARTSSGLIFDATTWSLDTFGQYLVGCSSSDGKAYVWRGTSDATALAMANAPVNNRGLFVTDERMVVLLGAAGNPRNVQWCAQGDYTVWAPAATNTAGSLIVNTTGALMAGMRYAQGTYLLFTDIDVHTMSYIGQPFVYGLNRVGDKCGLLGPHAKVAVNGGIVWMSPSNFHFYNGAVTTMPCEVQERVFGNINVLQGAKACAGLNSQFGEVWFFYASALSSENDRYVVWNYKENIWYTGALGRTAWVDRGAWQYVVASGPGGNLFQHEQGWTDNGVSRVGSVYAESGPLMIGNGDNVMDVSSILLDTNAGEDANVALKFLCKRNAQDVEVTAGPYANPKPTGEIDARFGAKQIKVRVELQADGPFDFGLLRLDAKKGSAR